MRKVIVNSGFLQSVILCCAFFLISNNCINAQEGEALYNRACKACHTIGGGKTVGPDLKGVNQKRDKEWLVAFIKSSQTLIKEGDALSIELFEEYMKIPMPDQNFTDAEISQILLYVDQASGVSSETTAMFDKDDQKIIANSDNGRNLFVGNTQFENNGASCIACHTVNDEAAYYAGTFAKDLTQSYILMQKAGIESVLQYLSFPAMSDTYKDHQLTASEIADLTAFLKEVSGKKTRNKIAGFGSSLLLYGFIAFLGLLAIIEIFWRNKKRDAVK